MPDVQMTTTKRFAFKSAQIRARLAIGSIVVALLVKAVDLYFNWHLLTYVQLLQSGQAGQEVTQRAEFLDRWSAPLSAGQLIITLLSAVLFLMWLYRVRCNFPALGIDQPRWTPGSAVGWWFVPVMNLIRPFQIMRETWKATDPEATGEDWKYHPGSPLVAWWWAAFLASIALNVAGGQFLVFEGYQKGTVLLLAGGLFFILSSFLAMALVRGIDRRQTLRYAKRVSVSVDQTAK